MKTCVEGAGMRTFRNDDVLMLDGLRCSGAAHGGCDKGCALFWKEAWLRTDQHFTGEEFVPAPGLSHDSGFRTLKKPTMWYCQSTELRSATMPMSRGAKISMCLKDLRASTYSVSELMRMSMTWVLFRARSIATGRHILRGSQLKTPKTSLGLQEGDEVVVRPPSEISTTLDRHGKNRGLEFTSVMVPFCGGRYRVKKCVKRIVMEATGEIRDLENTVVLENVTCDGHVLLGGCPRNQYHLWREIWLRRADVHNGLP
jgi:hypothetical protein